MGPVRMRHGQTTALTLMTSRKPGHHRLILTNYDYSVHLSVVRAAHSLNRWARWDQRALGGSTCRTCLLEARYPQDVECQRDDGETMLVTSFTVCIVVPYPSISTIIECNDGLQFMNGHAADSCSCGNANVHSACSTHREAKLPPMELNGG
jgi:hypothetical protein